MGEGGASEVWAIVPAAGRGQRVGASVPKQYLPLAGRPLLEHTLDRLLAEPRIRTLVVALAPEDTHWPTLPQSRHPRVQTVIGGAQRCHSVLQGLRWLETQGAGLDWVLVHDAARPCIRTADLAALLRQGMAHEVGALLAVPVRDTMKRANTGREVIATVAREDLWHAQTPQMFRVGALREAIESALAADVVVTDEAQAMERRGLAPLLVAGHADNIKVTEPDDYGLAEALLARQAEASRMRIGHGFDAHRFSAGRRLILGGVDIPHSMGMAAHSDGDVPIHALCDALLGAAALGDIGRHFPDTDAKWEGVDSRVLLRQVVARVRERGYRIVNADVTIIAQQPKLAPHIPAMQSNLAADLNVALDCVNVKATTTERMGFTGREEGIAASAIALLENR